MTYLILCALLMLTACSEAIDTLPEQQTPAEAVAFTAYLNRTTDNTRGGQTGAIDIAALRRADVGFGVFAFLGDDDRLYTSGTQMPDFMYNQKVCGKTTDNTTWEYSPLKYWPNETGSDAVSTNTDRLSFFAYAPYVGVNPETGLLTDAYSDSERTTGIVALSSHHHRGDPWVQYVVGYNADALVDLCYAEVSSEKTLNQTKHTIGSNVELQFRHALSALNIQVDVDADVVGHSDGETLDNSTCVWVRSVTLDGLATEGILNLNSTAAGGARWLALDGSSRIASQPVTIHDGRRDGREGAAEALYEAPIALNPDLVQSGLYSYDNINGLYVGTADHKGVTTTYKNLFTPPTTGTDDEKLAAPLYFIPTGDALRITIAYDVETCEPNILSTYLADGKQHGQVSHNVISKTVQLSGSDLIMQPGQRYTLLLHLGLTSAQFTAEVTPWEETSTAHTDVPMNRTYLTLETMEDNTEIQIVNPKNSMQYSIDNGRTWKDITTTNNVITVTKAGTPVLFRGTATGSYGAETQSGSTAIKPNKPCYIYGNVMSLVEPEINDFKDLTKLDEDPDDEEKYEFMFKDLFKGRSNLYNHPYFNILLPATTLTEACYQYMFSGCSNLTRAPQLPATTVTKDCYHGMFTGCSHLKTVPYILPALTLAQDCYREMFSGCTSLEVAPILPASNLETNSATGCYQQMFYGCSSLTKVTCLATELGDYDDASHGTVLNWLKDVPTTGLFIKAADMPYYTTDAIPDRATEGSYWLKDSPNGIPTGWTVTNE